MMPSERQGLNEVNITKEMLMYYKEAHKKYREDMDRKKNRTARKCA